LEKYLKILFVWIGLFALQSAMAGIPPRPEPARFVNDFAGMLSEGEQRALESKLRGYFDSTSTQIVVVTLQSLEGDEAWSVGQQIGQAWGVGQDKNDNGVVFLISKEDRKINISVGYGLEARIPDIYAKRIIRDIVSPNFKAGQFYGGIDQAIDRMIEYSSGEFKADPKKKRGDELSAGQGMVVFFFVLLFIFIVIAMANRRNRYTSFDGRGSNSWIGPTLFNVIANGMLHGNRGGGGGGNDGFDFGGGDFGGGGASGDW